VLFFQTLRNLDFGSLQIPEWQHWLPLSSQQVTTVSVHLIEK